MCHFHSKRNNSSKMSQAIIFISSYPNWIEFDMLCSAFIYLFVHLFVYPDVTQAYESLLFNFVIATLTSHITLVVFKHHDVNIFFQKNKQLYFYIETKLLSTALVSFHWNINILFSSIFCMYFYISLNYICLINKSLFWISPGSVGFPSRIVVQHLVFE